MIKRQFDSKIEQLLIMRNRLLVAFGLTGFLLLVLLIAVLLLASHRERIVVLPDVVTEPFTLFAKKASPSYLRQMGDYYTRLIYSTTPQSVDAQIETLLFHVPPQYLPTIKSELIAYADTVKKKNLVSAFYPTQFTLDEETLTLDISGDFTLLLGHEQVRGQKAFRLQFLYQHGRLWIKHIEEIVS